jgi:hypothetical protein
MFKVSSGTGTKHPSLIASEILAFEMCARCVGFLIMSSVYTIYKKVCVCVCAYCSFENFHFFNFRQMLKVCFFHALLEHFLTKCITDIFASSDH